jgi:hypothetical protein
MKKKNLSIVEGGGAGHKSYLIKVKLMEKLVILVNRNGVLINEKLEKLITLVSRTSVLIYRQIKIIIL